MAGLHHEFCKFHARIALASGNKFVLQMAREAIRERIRRYFRDTLQVVTPKFRGQGTYAMGTMVNPLDGEYGIDDGVYLQHLDGKRDSTWPSVGRVQRWLEKAVDCPGRAKVSDKWPCVRIRYKGLYHVNIGVYAKFYDQYRLLATGDHDQPHSDPSALTEWFRCHVSLYGEQLERIVRFVNAWADFQSCERGDMPGGSMLAILATRHFQNHRNDDVSLAYTLRAISNAVKPTFYVPNPVDLGQELTQQLTHVQKENFKNAVSSSSKDAIDAITHSDFGEANRLWRKILGGRFPS